MLEVQQLELRGGTALGVRVQLPVAPLVLVRARRGFVMCGYLNMEAMDKMGEVAVRVTGVRSFDDVLRAKVAGVSQKARELGISEGMSGQEALEKMF
ncbi:MAG: DUF1805 domain-containing protein [Thermoplasmata archaeon]